MKGFFCGVLCVMGIGLSAAFFFSDRTHSTLAINSSEKQELAALKIEGNSISPVGGVDIEVAKDLFSTFLIEDAVKGDVQKNLLVEEITIREAWEANGIQLYSVILDYAWLYGVGVILDGQVVGILSGMPTTGVFIADLNHDARYEVCTHALWGSGMIDSRIYALDTYTAKSYELAMRGEYDLTLESDPDTNSLIVYGSPFMSEDSPAERLGKLVLLDDQLAWQ